MLSSPIPGSGLFSSTSFSPSLRRFQLVAQRAPFGSSSSTTNCYHRGVYCAKGRSNPSQEAISDSGSLFQEEGSDSGFAAEDQQSKNGAARSAGSADDPAHIEDAEVITDEVVSKTKRLVETAMLAATAGLAYFLSNSLRIENYFGCFFPLPPLISSLRWDIAAGRKTMIATALLLLVLSGPLKAATYMLMHGSLGLTMGLLWRLEISWAASVLICTLVRSLGAMGFVFLSSWLLRENILALITVNAHASITYMLGAVGVDLVPSMGSIYFIFGTLVLLNCGSFVFLLHVLYAFVVRRLGLKSSVAFPAWLNAL